MLRTIGKTKQYHVEDVSAKCTVMTTSTHLVLTCGRYYQAVQDYKLVISQATPATLSTGLH